MSNWFRDTTVWLRVLGLFGSHARALFCSEFATDRIQINGLKKDQGLLLELTQLIYGLGYFGIVHPEDDWGGVTPEETRAKTVEMFNHQITEISETIV
jgi:hypothetical protein